MSIDACLTYTDPDFLLTIPADYCLNSKSCVPQFPGLAREFDLRALSIPGHDRTPFQDLVQLVMYAPIPLHNTCAAVSCKLVAGILPCSAVNAHHHRINACLHILVLSIHARAAV